MSIPKVVAVALVSLAAAGAAAAPAEAQFAYKAGDQRYRLEQVVEQTQEMGGQKMSNTISTTQLLGVRIAPAGDSLAVTFTVDSVVIDSPQPQVKEQGQAAADRLVGRQINGTLSTLGKILSLEAPGADSATGGEQFAAGFRSFFPRFPRSALQAGMSWTDTTRAEFHDNGIDGTSTSIVTYTVEGDTAVGGMQGWRVTQKGTVTLNGKGNSQGQDLALDGGGTMDGTAVVSKDGVYLGSDAQLKQNMTVQVVAMGIRLPITQSIRSKVRRVE